jgi:ABC-type thiamin/hydroxymethylpyrimidine transport system permease subunit
VYIGTDIYIKKGFSDKHKGDRCELSFTLTRLSQDSVYTTILNGLNLGEFSAVLQKYFRTGTCGQRKMIEGEKTFPVRLSL